jgi:hypothetical protein
MSCFFWKACPERGVWKLTRHSNCEKFEKRVVKTFFGDQLSRFMQKTALASVFVKRKQFMLGI